MSNTAFNPYAAPAAPVEDVSANAQAEAVRKEHISHEASIKAVGLLYYLGAAGAVIAGLAGLFAGRGAGVSSVPALLFVGLGVGYAFAAWGLRGLRPWGRIVGIVLACIGLLGFPIGTLINAYILYLFLSKKGRTIYSPEYQDVIAATPHVRYKTSILVWIFLALLVALFAFAILAPMFGK